MLFKSNRIRTTAFGIMWYTIKIKKIDESVKSFKDSLIKLMEFPLVIKVMKEYYYLLNVVIKKIKFSWTQEIKNYSLESNELLFNLVLEKIMKKELIFLILLLKFKL